MFCWYGSGDRKRSNSIDMGVTVIDEAEFLRLLGEYGGESVDAADNTEHATEENSKAIENKIDEPSLF